MRAAGLRVAASRGEEVRRCLVAAGSLRGDLRVVREEGWIIFPVTGDATMPPEWGIPLAREFEPRGPRGPTDYRDLLAIDRATRDQLPRSFDVVGDTVLIRIPAELESRRSDIGQALLEFVPGARIVGWDRGVGGPERRRRIERIAGVGSWATHHRENGVVLEVDVERAYFSPRLAHEHARVAEEVRAGDRVYDLCCGVGPFSVEIARRGRATSVIAVDANPAAIELLQGTLSRYQLNGRVTAVEGRIEEFVRDRARVERVILNLPLEGIKYVASAAALVAPRGRLYYYEVVPRDQLEGRPQVIRSILADPDAWTTVAQRIVHPYSPRSDLVAFVLERSGG